jgi:hypothetical protein
MVNVRKHLTKSEFNMYELAHVVACLQVSHCIILYIFFHLLRVEPRNQDAVFSTGLCFSHTLHIMGR